MAAFDNSTPHFPDEIWTEIFIKLPVRSLLLFKSVSKHWLALIQNPSFTNLHFIRPVSSNDPILVLRGTGIDMENIVLTMLSDDENLPYQDDLPLAFISPAMAFIDLDLDPPLHLLGPCNGLFCVTDTVEVVVFNPATRRCRKVYPLHESRGYAIGCFEYESFGYDDVANDYKVVRFYEEECGDEIDDDECEVSFKQVDHHVVDVNDDENDHDVDNNEDENDHDVDNNEDENDHDVSNKDDDSDEEDDSDVEEDYEYDVGNDYKGCLHGLHFKIDIYSLSTNTWREIHRVVPATNISTFHSYDLFFNGAFHWLHACAILVFDLNKEAFKWFKLPDSYVKWLKSFDSLCDGTEDDDFRTYLSVFNESLALTVHRKFDYWKNMYVGIEIWVMMEYGVHRSWRKQYKISPDVGIRRPLSFTKEGELLAEKKDTKKWLIPGMDRNKRELVSFNLKTRAMKTFQVHGVPHSMHAFRYRESLVSLK